MQKSIQLFQMIDKIPSEMKSCQSSEFQLTKRFMLIYNNKLESIAIQ